ncbi:PD-(D/E)XK nuclease-like domain-containing protein [Intestinimonas butyriciproducens]|nr:PD-(D/E)XK nuclease-like domain-containing protein [Intestinimonas butyriciproducens]MCR1905163.1 PD-(D/E)XK nuclease-like domain-containing protein [Intestinimonas butyriciproducens]
MPEIQMAYMGSSQFKAFRRCEAAALAELEGRYATPKTSAILVGAYVDAYFEGTLAAFKAQNPELFKRDGALKAEYAHAEKIISRLEADGLYMLLMSGQKQVVLTGEIAGVPYKIKIDSLLDADTCREIVERYPLTSEAMGFCEGAIVDQKIMRDTADVWSDEEWGMVPFARAWGYDIQGAIYQAVEGHMLPFILAVGTKEAEPNLDAIYIPDQELTAKLEEVRSLSPRYQAIKRHEIEPVSCGTCPYCISRKHLDRITDYRMVNEHA